MIISDLSYLELASDASDLEGGDAVALNITSYHDIKKLLHTTSSSGPGGSTASTLGVESVTKTFGLSYLRLG